jgi:hypothetical protein
MYLKRMGSYSWDVKSGEFTVYRILTRERFYSSDEYLVARGFSSRTPFVFTPPKALMSYVQRDWKYSFTTSLADGLDWLRGVGIPEEEVLLLLEDLKEKGWELDKELLQEYNTE